MCRFIVVTEGLAKTEADAISAVLTGSGYQFWHWIEGFWLVLLPSSTMTGKEFHTEITSKIPGLEPKTMLVMRIDEPISYWGRANKAAWTWMETYKIGQAQ